LDIYDCVIIIISCSSLVEHRAITNFHQQNLFFVICFASFQAKFCSCNSSKTVLFQITLRLPFLRFPCGFQSSPCLVMLFWFFLKVCLIHLHFLILISLLTGICYVVSNNSLLLIVFGHHSLNRLRRHRLTKICSLLMISCVVFHVLDPYNNTLIKLLLNILSFVLLWIWYDWVVDHKYIWKKGRSTLKNVTFNNNPLRVLLC
jgi:hypothetical protein